jgi:hypothetical protein
MIGALYAAAGERFDLLQRLIRPEIRIEREDADIPGVEQRRRFACHVLRHGQHGPSANSEPIETPDRAVGEPAPNRLTAAKEKHDVRNVWQTRHLGQWAKRSRKLREELLRQHVGADRELHGEQSLHDECAWFRPPGTAGIPSLEG